MSTHRFVLPRIDGSWLTDPSPGDWAKLVAQNHDSLAEWDFDCQGRSLLELRHRTRKHVRQEAHRYRAELQGEELLAGEKTTAFEPDRWIVTGHQPELFHVGVWVKNLAVAQLARRTQSTGLNLIVDNDTHSGTAIKVPAGTPAAPQLQTIPFDASQSACPWEELLLQDRALFESFPQRVAAALEPWNLTPVLSEFWPAAVMCATRHPKARLSDCLAAMRMAAERRWGYGNLELPLSRLDPLPGFLWFAAHILAHLPRFQTVYNDSVHDYRRRHHLRSRTHPVPDLAVEEEWREAPFWVWRAGDAQRDRLFARQLGDEIWLRDRREIFLKLPLSPERSGCCAVERLAELPARGIRLRSRALTTTLFARLFLADLFVHGIGGAKYDEMTDVLLAKFYGAPVPLYATISATLHLPLTVGGKPQHDSPGANSHETWKLVHNPDRFIADPEPAVRQLMLEKQQLIAEQQAISSAHPRRRSFLQRAANRRRYQRFQEINRLLQPAANSVREQLLARRNEMRSQMNALRIVASREFAWALFPKGRLQSFLLQNPVG